MDKYDKLKLPTVNLNLLPVTEASFVIPHFDLYVYSSFWKHQQLFSDVRLAAWGNVPATHFLDGGIPSSSFAFLRKSTMKSFFSASNVDMPLCFKKSKSLYLKTFEVPLLKLTNLLMRRGCRIHALRAVTSSFNVVLQQTLVFLENATLGWDLLYNLFLNVSWSKLSPRGGISVSTSMHLDSNVAYTKNVYNETTSSSMLPLFISKLTTLAPIFSFYIRRVSKAERKHSRGKSGKYRLIWKYVPVYKRLYLTMRWLLKELRFQKALTFQERLEKIFFIFFFNTEASLLYQLRQFTHRYVFKNFKKTLMKTLKSV